MVASCPLIRLLANPYQLATILLGISAFLTILTTIPPSTLIYLVRADYTTNGGDSVTQTAWFGPLGYCASSDGNGVAHSDVQCSGAMLGYNVKEVLGLLGADESAVPEALAASKSLTAGSAVLNPVIIASSLIGLAGFQGILHRHAAFAYAIAMGGSMLALLTSGIAFMFEYSLKSFVVGGFHTTNTTATTSSGPLSQAIVWALVFQLAACTVGFYACIGGKYDCEGGIRLEDEEETLLGGSTDCEQQPILDEKSAI
ncbi:hypothetical protein F4808DRAFT_361791 [Astrocystis sublimbata]|nr:hypothetical protein F4808DRAFT_361791 [Astrocystis sublimbata]